MNTATRRTTDDKRHQPRRRVRLAEVTASAALERVKHAFGREGFTVLAEIDLRDALKRRIDRDVDPYWVIELCHPVLASGALAIDSAAGLDMLFKVGVWQEGKDTVVSAAELTGEAEAHLERALASLAA